MSVCAVCVLYGYDLYVNLMSGHEGTVEIPLCLGSIRPSYGRLFSLLDKFLFG